MLGIATRKVVEIGTLQEGELLWLVGAGAIENRGGANILHAELGEVAQAQIVPVGRFVCFQAARRWEQSNARVVRPTERLQQIAIGRIHDVQILAGANKGDGSWRDVSAFRLH